eukprot:TRINITY_DN14961_c0_g1_i1.p1 TRINITY_DN14961_c0_g1~~TRINITY_DN14961_c0_g1_i1.p1  ORF type:complete len:542 (+),score=50.73 TRINITY_DN14961_c0_g1_i1:35-1660(+)
MSFFTYSYWFPPQAPTPSPSSPLRPKTDHDSIEQAFLQNDTQQLIVYVQNPMMDFNTIVEKHGGKILRRSAGQYLVQSTKETFDHLSRNKGVDAIELDIQMTTSGKIRRTLVIQSDSQASLQSTSEQTTEEPSQDYVRSLLNGAELIQLKQSRDGLIMVDVEVEENWRPKADHYCEDCTLSLDPDVEEKCAYHYPSPIPSKLNDKSIVTVAIIDSGICPVVIDNFQKQYYNRPEFRSFTQNSDKPNDNSGHGTHIAGIICNLLANCLLSTRILVAQVTESKSAPIRMYDIAEAIKWAVQSGADVINCSITPDRYRKELPFNFLEAVEIALKHRVMLVLSIGNKSEKINWGPSLPEGVILAGSLNRQGEGTEKSGFNPTNSEEAHIYAIGSNVISWGKHDNVPGQQTDGTETETKLLKLAFSTNVCRLTGTSMSAADVSARLAHMILHKLKSENDYSRPSEINHLEKLKSLWEDESTLIKISEKLIALTLDKKIDDSGTITSEDSNLAFSYETKKPNYYYLFLLGVLILMCAVAVGFQTLIQ